MPPDPHVPLDLPCVHCRYNLRALPVDRPCPECGHPAIASLLHAVRADGFTDVPEESLEQALQPCLDAAEVQLGFPLEAVSYVITVWPRVRASGAHEHDADLAEALRDCAVDFVGDPFAASRAMQRWNLADPAHAARLVRQLLNLRIIE